MAKTKMLCPFSKELCRECPQYRGRHYYLCFYTKYRGYLGNQEKEAEQKSKSSRVNKLFTMPSPPPVSPKWLILNEFTERKGK